MVPPTPTGFTVTWKNYDGSVIKVDTNVPIGTTPSYRGETPTRPDDDQYTYTFEGWSPAIVAVNANATYTATFKATEKPVETTHTAIFVDEEGNETQVEYKDGEDPVEKAPEIPEKVGYDGRWEKHIDEETGEEIYKIVYDPKTYEVIFVDEEGNETKVEYPYGIDSIENPKVPEKFGYDVKWDNYRLNDDPSIKVQLVYTPKTFEVIFVYDDELLVVEYTYGAESIEEPEIPAKFMFSAAWEPYELNESESVKVQIVYTINLWWLIILLIVMIGVEIFIIIYNKKKDKGNGEATKLGGGALFLAGSIVNKIPSFGVWACIVLGAIVIALGVVCIIVSLKKANGNADSVKWEENKDGKESE